ncbi:glycosyltransferase family 4 protein [Sphingomonas faeni]|uniref:glycosyltransferase family 4 protein n=1 Tax=Sphingomonas faeni TaxID=185950 RepID=UPI0020C7AE74|nr:glycosyltransferase family 4 protein [Sphingomonas faeni]
MLISDYSGHPFQVQLSRELARKGHEILHTYSAGFQTPKGNLVVAEDDPVGFAIQPVRNSKPFVKNSFFRRRSQEIEIGHELAKLCADFKPDIVVSSNAPLDTQRILFEAARLQGAKFVFWLQDIYSEAIGRVIPSKFPIAGHLIAAWYKYLEFRILKNSDYVVAITPDFLPILSAQGVRTDAMSVIENWAPLDELPRHPRENEWAQSHMPGDAIRIVYSGTLGYKHNPALLKELAWQLPTAHIHVFSEGEVADKLRVESRSEGLRNLSIHPWVSFADLPKMLSGADILVAIIEPDAGIYSVPSKVLTYLGIGRPVLASVPLNNLAARLIKNNQAGFASPPGQELELINKAQELAADPALRQVMGDNGRKYANHAFDIEAIGSRFLDILSSIYIASGDSK